MAPHVIPAARRGGDALLLPKPRPSRRPGQHPFRLSRRRRARIEALIEHLVGLLNAADGDPDLEDSHDQEWDLADREPDSDGERGPQLPITPDSTRPTTPIVIESWRTLSGGEPELVTMQFVPARA